MVDHNALRVRLDSTISYKQLNALRGEIIRSKGQLPFSIYADLLNRTDEKIRTFDYPMCANARINLQFSNGLKKELATEECLAALAGEGSLSSYIFTKYPSTNDYTMAMVDMTGTMVKDHVETKPEEKETEHIAPPPPTQSQPPNTKLEEEVRNLSNRVDRMEQTFNEEIPKINKKMNDLEVKMDYLYFNLVKKPKEEKKD